MHLLLFTRGGCSLIAYCMDEKSKIIIILLLFYIIFGYYLYSGILASSVNLS